MSKTALTWVIGLVTGTVLSFRDPIFGLLAYLWEYYNHPPMRWWGDELPDLRWSLLVASMLFASYSFHGKTIFRREIFRHKSTQWLRHAARHCLRRHARSWRSIRSAAAVMSSISSSSPCSSA